MLKLVITAPNKQKVELECQPSDTFGDVKKGVERSLGVPPDKQRLLCNGKERKDAKETLAAAGVTAKSKLMLMLVPGYSMPAAPAAAEAGGAAETAPAAEVAEAPPVDVEGTLPLPEGVPAGEAGTVQVRQGRNRYRVRVPQGLAAATFGELADYLAAELLPRGIPASELRILSRGKTVARGDALLPGGGSELSVMLLFRENFHLAVEGAAWLKEQSAELEQAEVLIGKLRKRIEANFCDAETSVQLAEVGALVDMLRQSVDSVGVSETKLPEMQKFRDRVLAADAQLETMRKGVRL